MTAAPFSHDPQDRSPRDTAEADGGHTIVLETDVVVIGAGSAGMSAYRAAKKRGVRVILVEAHSYGTLCAQHACMPSKLLIAAANAAYDTTLLDGFGIALPQRPEVGDGARVLARVRAERDRFVASVIDDVDGFPASDKLKGRARFLSDRTLLVTPEAPFADPDGPRYRIETGATVIATGAKAVIPDDYRALGDIVCISDDIFEWKTLPRRIGVVGTGVIALELGQALSRLGVEVTMFGHNDSLAGLQDPAVRDYAFGWLRTQMPIHSQTSPRPERLPDGSARLHWHASEAGQDEDAPTATRTATPSASARFVDVDRVLVATGRAPVFDGLGLDNTTLHRDQRGIPRFDGGTMQCLAGRSEGAESDAAPGQGQGDGAAPPIFIAGDVDGQRPWLNDAANEGRIAGDNAARLATPEGRTVTQTLPTPMSLVFSDPVILQVGARFASLDPRRFVTGAIDFAHQGRSQVVQRAHGLLHVYVDIHSGTLLGAEGIAPAGEHLAHLLAWSIQQGLSVDDTLGMPFYHPVFEEGLRTALREAMRARGAAKRATANGGNAATEIALSEAIGT
ncbi:dihydrolipoyl dehydrogenase [Robbsia sp. KACC 23696]|uniref:dihydrolipoyl dehydrogenase n=1 Tax=Robbsia sp. KACC 23696 TaxID=3149231 RepID=UPI00325C17A7